MLPGIQAGPAEFARLVPRLTGDVRVVALPESETDTLPGIAHELERLLPPGAHDFVAASFGGLLAWALPAARVRSLVTIGTLPWRTDAADRSLRAGRVLPYVPEAVYRRWYRARIRASFVEDGATEEECARVTLPPRLVLAARLRAIGGWDLPDRPPVCATWLWGATDRWVTWDPDAVRQAGHEPVIVPGGHRPHLSHGSEVVRWVEGG